MFRLLLPVVVCLIAAPVLSDTIILPEIGITPQAAPEPCPNVPGSQASCSRILACVGNDGLWFDGRAVGWDAGIVTGRMSDGSTCEGEWRSGFAFGTGRSVVSCSDGSRGQVIYYIQHNETGTVEGRGVDTMGRGLKVWTGLNVVDFLKDASGRPRLPCTDDAIPIG